MVPGARLPRVILRLRGLVYPGRSSECTAMAGKKLATAADAAAGWPRLQLRHRLQLLAASAGAAGRGTMVRLFAPAS